MRPNEEFFNIMRKDHTNYPPVPYTISGGTETTVGLDTLLTFNSNGTLTVVGGGLITCLLLGGGHGGTHKMNGNGGDGGSGGSFTYSTVTIPPGTYNIIVGPGGSGEHYAGNSPGNTIFPAQAGTASQIVGILSSSVGGGAGGSGAFGYPTLPFYGVGGSGVTGIVSNITGTTTSYAGGGGGGSTCNTSTGPNSLGGGNAGGGGGAGGQGDITSTHNGNNAPANNGGGGGGGGGRNSGGGGSIGNGGNGGSGVVMIRYRKRLA